MPIDPETRRDQETAKVFAERFNPPVDKVNEKRPVGRPRKEVIPVVTVFERDLFIKALFVIMSNFQVRAANDVAKCVPAAEEAVRIVMEKYEDAI